MWALVGNARPGRDLGGVVEGIHGLGLKSGAQTEALRELADGSRTIRELVHLMYGVDRESPSYETYYMRVRRALKFLEARGYVSSSLFEKEKTYRLTKHGRISILSVARGLPETRLLGRADLVLLAMVLVSGAVALGPGGLLPRFLDKHASSLFILLVGLCLGRVLTVLGEVN